MTLTTLILDPKDNNKTEDSSPSLLSKKINRDLFFLSNGEEP
jgi:hypothetical protein